MHTYNPCAYIDEVILELRYISTLMHEQVNEQTSIDTFTCTLVCRQNNVNIPPYIDAYKYARIHTYTVHNLYTHLFEASTIMLMQIS